MAHRKYNDFDQHFLLHQLHLGKNFSEDFSDFRCKSSVVSEVSINKGIVIWKINEMKPGEIIELEITADIFPKEKEIIGTGNIQISYDYKDYLISGINVENFFIYIVGFLIFDVLAFTFVSFMAASNLLPIIYICVVFVTSLTFVWMVKTQIS